MTTEGQIFGLFSGQGGASTSIAEMNVQLPVFEKGVSEFQEFLKLIEFQEIRGLYGHSLGGYPAAVAAGAIKFEPGKKLVEKRTEFFAQEPLGAMAICKVDIAKRLEIERLIEGTNVIKAIKYSDSLNVYAGDSEVIDKLFRDFPDVFMKLAVIRAAHHELNRPVLEKMRKLIDEMTESGELVFSDPKIPLYGSDGEILKTGEEVKNDLIVAHVSPVDFAKLSTIIKEINPSKIVEFGGLTLAPTVNRNQLIGIEVTPARRILNSESHRRAA